jgi:hypothetical protein
MKKAIDCFMVFTFLMICQLFLMGTAVADDQDLFTQGSSYVPNVLIILDNSQSMDQDFSGNGLAPYKTNSRLVEAKRALQQVVSAYSNQMRIGLMTYKLDSVSAYNVHSVQYFTSYQTKSYCPSTADSTVFTACKNYCETGNTTSRDTCQAGCRTAAGTNDFDATYLDEIITNYSASSEQRIRYCNLIYPKTQRYQNSTDATNYVYYKMPAAFYDTSDDGTAFCYSRNYNASESGSDNYRCFATKTGTNDGTYVSPNPGQYSGSYADYTFAATDDDIALGYRDFGRREAWYHTGKTWFSSSSPGGGYLHVDCATNPSNNSQLNALLAKLDMKEGNESGYMNSTSCSGNKSNSCPFVINAGLTPMAGTLQSAIDYFKGNYSGKNSPIQDSCQKNFVIFITDGLPSVGTNGNKDTAAVLMPDVLAKIDALRAIVKTLGSGSNATDYTFNILTYVIGVAITPDAQSYLDTMASRGGTAVEGKALYADNTAAIMSRLNEILSDITSRSYAFATASISSSRTADENYIYEATFEPIGSDYPFWKGYLKKWALKSDGSLDYALWDAGSKLQSTSAGSRVMKTLIGGNLVGFKYSNQDGSEPTPVSYLKMGVADQATADKIIKYIRGYATDPNNSAIVTNPDNWKLGDIFHSSPITLGTPTPFFNDTLETNPNPDPDDSSNKAKGFDVYRRKHIRASHCSDSSETCEGYGKRMIVVGANDGQYHAFNAATGYEFWSFVPPNLLPKLQYLAHYTTSSTLGHNFFVDGRTTATDAWLPASLSNGTQKSYLDWKTLVMFSLGRNDRDYTTADKSSVPQTTKLWSKYASCDSDLAEYYNSSTAPYYCGYYAFDFTNAPSTLPSFKWTLQPDSTSALYLGEPWSAVAIGRVKISGNERWIGVIGGGYNAANCSTSTCSDKRGKGIIVFDLRTGQTLWSYNWGTSNTSTTSQDMGNAIPSQVALVDGDYDGYLDHAYVGDIKGNMWQIKFCTKADLAANANCGTSSWKGSLLLDKLSGSDKYPIYMQPTMTRDSNGDTWLFWSSGDLVDPTGSGPAAYVYALKPLYCKDTNGNPVPCLRSNLDNITSSKGTYCDKTTTKWGWYINLAGKNEQVLSQPVAFDNVLYFTSFIPASGSSANCTKTGTAQLYGISIDTSASSCNAGAGIFSGGSRYITAGAGIASGVLLSYNPNGTMNAYVTVSGAGGQEGGTLKAPFVPSSVSNRSNMLYWKDRRIQ